MNEPKDYAPIGAKEVSTKFGPLLKLSFNVDALIEWATARRNAKGWVNLNVSKRREIGKHGETHSVSLCTWQPQQRADDATAKRGFQQAKDAADGGDEPPF